MGVNWTFENDKKFADTISLLIQTGDLAQPCVLNLQFKSPKTKPAKHRKICAAACLYLLAQVDSFVSPTAPGGQILTPFQLQVDLFLSSQPKFAVANQQSSVATSSNSSRSQQLELQARTRHLSVLREAATARRKWSCSHRRQRRLSSSLRWGFAGNKWQMNDKSHSQHRWWVCSGETSVSNTCVSQTLCNLLCRIKYSGAGLMVPCDALLQNGVQQGNTCLSSKCNTGATELRPGNIVFYLSSRQVKTVTPTHVYLYRHCNCVLASWMLTFDFLQIQFVLFRYCKWRFRSSSNNRSNHSSRFSRRLPLRGSRRLRLGKCRAFPWASVLLLDWSSSWWPLCVPKKKKRTKKPCGGSLFSCPVWKATIYWTTVLVQLLKRPLMWNACFVFKCFSGIVFYYFSWHSCISTLLNYSLFSSRCRGSKLVKKSCYRQPRPPRPLWSNPPVQNRWGMTLWSRCQKQDLPPQTIVAISAWARFEPFS